MSARADRHGWDAQTRAGTLVHGTPASFDGAVIQLYGVEVLVVRVTPRVFADGVESMLLVAAFHARFRRTVVLATRDSRGAASYFGPGPIANTLAAIPFDALSWRQYRYQEKVFPLLPIPLDIGDATDSRPSFSFCDPPDTERAKPSSSGVYVGRSSQATRALRKNVTTSRARRVSKEP